MRYKLTRMSRITLTVLTTIFATILALSIVWTLYYLWDIPISSNAIKASIITPLVIAPLIAWYVFGILKEFEALEKKMRYLAEYDPLTGLLNRRAFEKKSTEQFHQAKNSNNNLAILMLDLDHFKTINDRFGHAAGDLVLQTLGDFLNQHNEHCYLIGRIGGEEFIILVSDKEAQVIDKFTDSLLERIRELKFKFEDSELQITCSIGLSCFNPKQNTTTVNELIKEADKALYQAKNSGRDKAIRFNEALFN